jgi:predicted nucleic acid-binding protein
VARLTVVDTSVLLAWLEPAEPHHKVAVEELTDARASGDLAIPVTAFAEALVRPYRQSPQAGRRVERKLMEIGRIVPTSIEVGRRAAQLRSRSQVKLPDALIVATGLEMRATAILTLDERLSRVDPAVKVLC